VERHLASVERAAALVATGSLAVVPLTTGHWEFAFGDLGRLSLEVTP
jgi:hypothetical protein